MPERVVNFVLMKEGLRIHEASGLLVHGRKAFWGVSAFFIVKPYETDPVRMAFVSERGNPCTSASWFDGGRGWGIRFFMVNSFPRIVLR